jgi:integral membrane sensor domain MASE1
MAAVLRYEELRRPITTGLLILTVAGLYFGSGRLGLLRQVNLDGVMVTPLWPPTGIALTCLLTMGLRIWPGIALGELLVIVSLGPVHAASAGIVAGSTLAPVCAFLLLRRADFHIALDRLRDGVALVFLGALGGMLISATVGSTTLLWSGSLRADDYWSTWTAWWAGDAMGVLVIAPLLLVGLTVRLPGEINPYQWGEAVLVMAGTGFVTFLVTHTSLDLLFLVFPLLIWSALRFQLVGAVLGVLLVSVITIGAATGHAGPFALQSIVEIMVTLQALNGAAALTTLLLAAVVTERRSTYRKIEQACQALTELVARLAPGEPAPDRWPEQPGEG